MSYSTVLFDMGGTVLNTLDDLRDAVNHTLVSFGMPERTLGEIGHFLGNGARHLIERSVPDGTSPEMTEAVLAAYLPYYKAHCSVKTAPYPGIIDLMRRLKAAGVRSAIVSNKPDAATRELSQKIFGDLIDFTIGEKADIRRKPAPDMVLEAIRELNAERSECVYIGDTEVDLETAGNSGIDCISVTYGFRNEEELTAAGAKVFARSAEELEKIILESP